jgi:hypothetical protein
MVGEGVQKGVWLGKFTKNETENRIYEIRIIHMLGFVPG